MITGHIIAALLPMAARSMRRWLFHLGGLGLIPLGLLDNSLIPLPGILDVAAIVMSSRQEQFWLYYGLMAAAGSVAASGETSTVRWFTRTAGTGNVPSRNHRYAVCGCTP